MSAIEQTEPWVPADTWGSRIAQVRQHLGWNIKEAAQECGLSAESWRQWEKLGTRPRDQEVVAEAISKATGCSYVWLMVGAAALRTGRKRARGLGGANPTAARESRHLTSLDSIYQQFSDPPLADAARPTLRVVE